MRRAPRSLVSLGEKSDFVRQKNKGALSQYGQSQKSDFVRQKNEGDFSLNGCKTTWKKHGAAFCTCCLTRRY
jgi:hypothetical protein